MPRTEEVEQFKRGQERAVAKRARPTDSDVNADGSPTPARWRKKRLLPLVTESQESGSQQDSQQDSQQGSQVV